MIGQFLAVLLFLVPAQSSMGTVIGRLATTDGSPVVGIRVNALAASDGMPTTLAVRTETDAAGNYRLELPAGRYYITAGLLDTPVYFPGVRDRDGATVVTVAARTTLNNIDFKVSKAATGLKIKGRVVHESPAPTGNREVVFLNGGGQNLNATAAPDGTFEFAKVWPGDYVLNVTPAIGFRPRNITVEEKDIEGLELVVPWSVSINGTVSIDGTAPRPRVFISLVDPANTASALSSSVLVTRETFGMFLTSGTYGVAVSQLPAGYFLKSIRSGNTDLVANPLIVAKDAVPQNIQVTLGLSSPGPWVRVSGRVIGLKTNETSTAAQLMLNPTSGGGGEPLQVALASDGTFELPMVFPGQYNISIQPFAGQLPQITLTVPNRDLTGAEIEVPAIHEVTGRITVDGGGPLPNLFLRLTSAPGAAEPSNAKARKASDFANLFVAYGAPTGVNNVGITAKPDGSFSIWLPEGRFRIALGSMNPSTGAIDTSAIGPYKVKSLAFGGTDLLQGVATISAASVEALNAVLAPSSPNALVRVSGRVVNAETLFASSNVLNGSAPAVSLTSTDALRISMNAPISAEGSFEFPRVPGGTYTVRIVAPVPNISGITTTVSVGTKDVNGVELVVPRQKEISGRVLLDGRGVMPRMTAIVSNPASSVPSQSMSVNPQPDGSFKVTLFEGQLRFGQVSGLPAGYAIKAMTFGAVDLLSSPLNLSSASADELRITLTTPNVPPVKVSGRVRGYDPMRGAATIALSAISFNQSLSTPLGADGLFEFPEVFSGTYTARLVAPATLNPPSIPVVVATTDIRDLDMIVPGQRTVQGRVIIEGRGPFPRFSVRLTPTNTSSNAAQTTLFISPQPTGTFQVTLPEGERQVQPTGLPAGYTLKSFTYGDVNLLTKSLNVKTTDTAEIVATISAEGTPRKVSGKISGAGAATPGIRVTLAGTSFTTSLDKVVSPDGTFEFPEVFPGTYSVRALAVGVPAAIQPVSLTVGNADVTNLDLAVPGSKLVKGRMAVSGAGPLPRVYLQLAVSNPNGGTFASSLTLNPAPADGAFQVTLPEGDHRFAITQLPPGYTVSSFTYGPTDLVKTPQLKIAAADTDEFRLVLKASEGALVNVSGRVTGITSGIETIRVRLTGNNGERQTNATADGSFQFTQVFQGSYTLSAAAPNTSTALPPKTITVGDKGLFGLEIAVTAQIEVQGRIILEGNGPLPRFTLRLATNPGTTTVSVSPQPGGAFRITLPEGERQLQVAGLPSGYTMKSFMYGGVDMLRNPINVKVTDPAELVATLSVDAAPRKISGNVSGFSPGVAPPRVVLTSSTLSTSLNTPINPDGSFAFPEVFPGTYTARVIGPGVATSDSLAVPVVVGASDITDLRFSVPGSRVARGRVILSGEGPLPRISLQVSTQGARGGTSTAVMTVASATTDGSFQISLSEGEHRISLGQLPTGYMVASFSYGNTDLLRNPVLKVAATDTDEFRIALTSTNARSFSVKGRVTIDGAAPGANSPYVRIEAQRSTAAQLESSAVARDVFTLTISGDEPYRISVRELPEGYQVRSMRYGATDLVAEPLTFDGSAVEAIVVDLSPTATRAAGKGVNVIAVSGRVVADRNLASAAGILVGIQRESGAYHSNVHSDGTFTVILEEGEQKISVREVPTGYRVKSIRYGSKDVTTKPLKLGAADPVSALTVTLETN